MPKRKAIPPFCPQNLYIWPPRPGKKAGGGPAFSSGGLIFAGERGRAPVFPLPPVVRRLAPTRCTLSVAGNAKRLVHLARFRFPSCGKYPKESLPKRAILLPALPRSRRRTSLIDTGMITFKNADPNFTAAFSVRTHIHRKSLQNGQKYTAYIP